MKTKPPYVKTSFVWLTLIALLSCKTPRLTYGELPIQLPNRFNSFNTDSIEHFKLERNFFFNDSQLIELIDTALLHNQELNIVLHEIAISQSEVLEKQGEYLPFVDFGINMGTEKSARYTRNGAVEHTLEIDNGRSFPEPLPDFKWGASASWEVDVWHKLRDAKNASELQLLAQNQAKNFLITQLVAEIATTYYEWMALQSLIEILNQNVEVQSSALEKMRIMKNYGKVNQLVVNRFEAQLLNTQNQQFAINQKKTETENKLHVLIGKYPEGINWKPLPLVNVQLKNIHAGLPKQLLQNRPDIKQAEFELKSTKLNVQAAKASFYPKLNLQTGVGFQAFDPKFLIQPESLIYNLAGDLTAPLINRKAIHAQFNRATAKQIQSAYSYAQTVLMAYTEVLKQLSKLNNCTNSLKTKFQEVELLKQSVEIAHFLFQNAKADYVEVLLTQEEVLDAQMELIEIKLQEIHANIQLYKALGGGWQ